MKSTHIRRTVSIGNRQDRAHLVSMVSGKVQLTSKGFKTCNGVFWTKLE